MGFLYRLFNDGYERNGFNKDGYDKYGFNKDGYDKYGFFRDGFNKDGYDKYGFNKDGYDEYGFNKDGYDEYGFNKDGYDKYSYFRDGFNKYGHDRAGFFRDGFNKDGYDKHGFNKDGYDKHGYDKHGFNRYGYDKYGFNKDGYDKYGFNKDGYDKDGFFRTTLLNKTYYNYISKNVRIPSEIPAIELDKYSENKYIRNGLEIYYNNNNYKFYTLIVDYHGLTGKEAKEFTDIIVESANTKIGRISIIHGYHKGNTILRTLENYSNSKIIKKTYHPANIGRTFLYLKE